MDMSDKQLSAEFSRNWRVLIVLATLMGFAAISTDLYLPAMPTMAHELGAVPGTTEWTISSYLCGFALGQLFWGPVGDRIGRRLPVAIGLVLFVIGAAGCAMAGDIWDVIGARVVQSVGASAGVVLGRAMVRDLYDGDRAVQMMSTLMTVMAFAPLLGPSLGGQILIVAGWRAIFWTLVAIGTVTLLAILAMQETLPADRRNREPLSRAFADYRLLLRNRHLIAYAATTGFFYMGTFAFIAGSPFAYINYFHVTVGFYGLVISSAVIGIMAANTINAKLVTRYGGNQMLRAGSAMAALAGLAAAIATFSHVFSHMFGLWGLVVPMVFYCAANGLIVANCITGALAGFPERAGAVSALVGAVQYGSGIVGSALVGIFADGTPRPMVAIIAIAGFLTLLSALSLKGASRPVRLFGLSGRGSLPRP